MNDKHKTKDEAFDEAARLRGGTRKQKAEAALQESEKRYRQLVETANDIIFQTDANGIFTFVNPVALRITGYAEEEVIGRHYLDLIVPEHRKKVERFYGLQFVKKIDDTYYEYPVLTKEGNIVWLGQNVHLVLEGDAVVGFLSIARDITDRKKAEEELRQAKEELERRVEERTAELSRQNERLQQEIGERRRAEAALGESEANYRAIFNAANDAIFVHDLHTGEILDVNRKMCQMYGYSLDEALRLNVEALSSGEPPYSQEYALRWIKRVVDGEPQLFEWQAKDKQGQLFWVEVNLKRASIGSKDCVLAVVRNIAERKRAYAELNKAHAELEKRVQERTAELVAVNEDLKREIAERKRVEEWLRDSERRYRSLVDEVPDIIFILDREGRFTYVNTQIEALLGCSVKDLLETPLSDHVVTEDRHKIDALKALTVDSIWDEEVGLVDAKGTQKFARIRCKAAREAESDLLRFEGVMRNITRRKVLEEQLKASRAQLLEKIKIIDDLYAHIVESGKARAITDHTAEVAHELRQPLAIIGGFVRRIVRQLESSHVGIDDSQREVFRVIISEIRRLERILDNLIDFTKRDILNLERTDPNDIIVHVLTVYEGMLRNKDLNVEASLGEEVGALLLDPDRFEHVIRNLLSNAIEASDQGGTIWVETGVSIPSGKAHDTGELDSENYFEVKIRNRGAVIPRGDLEKIFTPFYTTKHHGTGTGLPLSKKIVEDHGGSISVHSDAEETVFTVWLPIKEHELALTEPQASEQS